jgi:hypothetical protein
MFRKDYRLIQIGLGNESRLTGCDYAWNLRLSDVEKLVKEVGYFISIDNFLHHLAYNLDVPGTVIFGPSDPEIFGYKTQINVIKDRSLLRTDQFGFWKGYKWPHSDTGWYPAEVIYKMGVMHYV